LRDDEPHVVWDGTPKTSRYLFCEAEPPRAGTLVSEQQQQASKRQHCEQAWQAWAQPLTVAELADQLGLTRRQATDVFSMLRNRLSVVGAPVRSATTRRMVYRYRRSVAPAALQKGRDSWPG
jgi:transcriptional regulator GlxA family with amidase domain